MYVKQVIAGRIKLQARKHKIQIGVMLSDLELGVNTISQLAKGVELSSITLAKIADYLDCSVDYLLCRTENPNAHKTHASAAEISQYDEQLTTIIDIYKKLDGVGKARLLVTADEIKKGSDSK